MYCWGMTPERARELLDRERARIEDALRGLAPIVEDEPTTAEHLADQDLGEAELDEGSPTTCAGRSPRSSGPRRGWRRARMGCRSKAGADSRRTPRMLPTAERTAAEQALYER